MIWLDKLERMFPRFGIPGLLRMVAFCMLITFGLEMAMQVSRLSWVLVGELAFHGEPWRLVTFLFVPVSSNPIFLMFELMILVMIGDALESAWGSFRLTIYYLCGALMTIVVAILFPAGIVGSENLNLSLFLAFATLFPDFEILLFFVIPVKVKYLAVISGFFLFLSIATGSWAVKLVTVLSIFNYLLFFGPAAWRAVVLGASNYERRRTFEAATKAVEGARHTCLVCGRTEVSHPDLEFRYCTCPQCGPDGKPFCAEHLKVHKSQLS